MSLSIERVSTAERVADALREHPFGRHRARNTHA